MSNTEKMSKQTYELNVQSNLIDNLEKNTDGISDQINEKDKDYADREDHVVHVVHEDYADHVVHEDGFDKVDAIDENKFITNNDLSTNQYSEKTLAFNMEKGTLTPYMVFKTQKNLSNEFIVEYILNDNYAEFMEDYDITITKVIGKFPNFANFDPKTYKKQETYKDWI